MEEGLGYFRDEEGKEHYVIATYTGKNRSFVIDEKKQIYEKDAQGNYKRCTEKDEEVALLEKYTQPPKSLDVE